MTQYEAIFQRNSVRKFQMKTVDAKTMGQINSYMQTVNSLHQDASYRLAVVEALNGEKPAMKGQFMTEAPYYLVLFAKEHRYAAQNAGYIMEQIVLYLTAKGLGTCYLGDVKTAPTADRYRCMIVVAFGIPASAACDPKGRRKPVAELVYYKTEASAQVRRILEAGRMAPSAFNSQPWRFVVYSNRVHIFMKKTHVPIPRWKELREISMGVLMTHLALAAEELWLSWRLVEIDDVAERELKGYEYTATLVFSEQDFMK